MVINTSVRHSIRLLDERSGWSFTLHEEGRRVWLVANPTETPVALSYLAGYHAGQLETLAAACGTEVEMAAVARRFLPPEVTVNAGSGNLRIAA